MPKPSSDQILAAAERVFAERGYGRTSLRDLVTAAECSTTAFYARFPGKEAVLEALVGSLLQDLHDAAEGALPQATNLAAGWDAGIEVLVAVLRERKGLVRIMLTEAAQVDGARTVLGRAYGGLVMLLTAQLARATRRRGDDPDDLEARAWALVGALSLQVTRWAVFEDLADADLRDSLDRCAQPLLPTRRAR
jgi:AcrR family transcriptional regulator